MHIWPTLSIFSLLIGKEEPKEKDLWVTLSSPFLLHHHFQHKWLANSGKEHEWERIWQGPLATGVYYNTTAFLHLKPVLILLGSMVPSPLPLLTLSFPGSLSRECNTPACAHFESPWAPTRCGPTGILCSRASWVLRVNGAAGKGGHHPTPLFTCMLHCPFDFAPKTQLQR